MIRSRALRTNNLKSGFARLTRDLDLENKSLIALMTPHFSRDQVSDVLNIYSKNNLVGGMVDGIHGYMGPCVSLSIVEDATLFEIPHGVFQSRDKSVGRWMNNQTSQVRMRLGGFDHESNIINPSLNDLSNSWLSHLPNKKKTFLFLAEKSSCHEFGQLLDAVYPNDSKMGIIASPMFFKSGDPACLFTSKVLGGGIVGYTIESRKVDMDFLDLSPFSPVLSIADCRGNVLLKWNGTGVSFDHLKDSLYVQLLDFEMNSVFQVIGGDPSKQNIVLDGEVELKPGMKFKFLTKNGSDVHSIPKSFSICFSVDKKSVEPDHSDLDLADGEISDAPLTASCNEGGIVGGCKSPCVISSIHDSCVYT